MLLNQKALNEIVDLTDEEWLEKTVNLGIGEITKDEFLLEEFIAYHQSDRRPPKNLVNWLAEKLSRMLLTKDPRVAFAFIKRRGRPALKDKLGHRITGWHIATLMQRFRRKGIKKTEAQLREAAKQLGISERQAQRILALNSKAK